MLVSASIVSNAISKRSTWCQYVVSLLTAELSSAQGYNLVIELETTSLGGVVPR